MNHDIPTYTIKPTDPIVAYLFHRRDPQWRRALSWWVFGLACGVAPWLWGQI